MTDDKPLNRPQTAARGDEARQERLKAKLRENLKRRKGQLKARGAAVSSDGHQPRPDGELGKSEA